MSNLTLWTFAGTLVGLVVTLVVVWLTRRWLRRRFPNGER